MWVAGMLAAAAVSDDVEQIIAAGLAQVPKRSRLVEAINRVINWKNDGVAWEDAAGRIHRLYDETNAHHWCHTISNAMIVASALLFGEGDFTKSIGIAVAGALDTDCNGATTGSIVGMMLGAKALPPNWTAPLNDTIKSGVDGFGLVKLSELAQRTVALIQTNPHVNVNRR